MDWKHIIPHRDGSHTVTTEAGNYLTVPAGVIPPSASYIDDVCSALQPPQQPAQPA